jgi:hypothetical protein
LVPGQALHFSLLFLLMAAAERDFHSRRQYALSAQYWAGE